MIKKSRMVFDVNANTLNRVLTFTCRNKECKEYEKEIGEEKIDVPFATE